MPILLAAICWLALCSLSLQLVIAHADNVFEDFPIILSCDLALGRYLGLILDANWKDTNHSQHPLSHVSQLGFEERSISASDVQHVCSCLGLLQTGCRAMAGSPVRSAPQWRHVAQELALQQDDGIHGNV